MLNFLRSALKINLCYLVGSQVGHFAGVYGLGEIEAFDIYIRNSIY